MSGNRLGKASVVLFWGAVLVALGFDVPAPADRGLVIMGWLVLIAHMLEAGWYVYLVRQCGGVVKASALVSIVVFGLFAMKPLIRAQRAQAAQPGQRR